MKCSANKNKFFLLTILLFISTSIFTSCHDAIFDMIDKEVKLESNGIMGDIHSIVPFGDFLYCANGKALYKKTNESSNSTGNYNEQWEKVSTTDLSGTIEFLASDNNYLYALTYTFSENASSYNVVSEIKCFYSSDGESFTEIDFSSTGISENYLNTTSYVKLFDNQASLDSGNRKAYIRLTTDDKNGVFYTLNGESYTVATEACKDSSSSTSPNSAVYFNGKTYFFEAYDATANDSYMYYATGNSSTLYYSDGSTENSVSPAVGSIYSLALTSDYLILGTSTGIKRLSLTSGVPASSATTFSSNASSILTNRIYMLYILNPSVAEGADDEYACMTIYGTLSSATDSFSETGLYAFYPNRGTWNRDGTADTSSSGN